MTELLETEGPNVCEAEIPPVSQPFPVPRPEPRSEFDSVITRENGQSHPLTSAVAAISRTLRTSWFWYSIASSLCWTGWAFTARLGSKEITPSTMQFISAFGFCLVAIFLFMTRKVESKRNLRANGCALISGVLLGLGGVALFGAYRYGDNASVVTAATSLYPVVTVVLAVTLLREKPNKLQLLGLGFAAIAILLLSA